LSSALITGGGGTAAREAASARRASRALCGVITSGSRSGSSGMIWAMTESSGVIMQGASREIGFPSIAWSDDRYAPRGDRRRRDDFDVERHAPALGQPHPWRFVAGGRAVDDETFKTVAHDLVAFLHIDREAANIGHEDARAARNVGADI